MKTDHWDKNAIKILKPYLVAAKKSLQVSTGFFTIQGYDVIRASVHNLWVQLLVGFDEHSKERLRELLVQDIMRYLSQWEEENRRAAVLDLVDRIQKRQFQIVENPLQNWVDAKARVRDHGKVYILDEQTVLAGSANLTLSGMRYNRENLTMIDEVGRISTYINRFKQNWNAEDTIDLTQELLEALLKWLELVAPFDIYLKTVQILIQSEQFDPPRATYKIPVGYQQVVIERVLRQIKAYRGAMLVASTGLGKTVMATHIALKLSRTKRITNVLVFSPVSVQPDWKYALRSAGVSFEIFTRDLLDRPSKAKGVMQAMEEALAHVDNSYLIIIDESQYFKNKNRMGGKKRTSFNRLQSVIKNTEALVLLLTATPYSKEVGDLNNQLQLLPHTAEKKYVQSNGQLVMPGMIDDAIAPEAWKVMDGMNFFEDFIRLPVATVISTSQVAKDFATSTDKGDYILFKDTKKWIPKVQVTKVKVQVYQEKSISDAIAKKVFSHKVTSFPDRKGNSRFSDKIIQNKLEIAWMSSPTALKQVLEEVINHTDKVKYKASKDQRKEILQPIINHIQEDGLKADTKLQALIIYLERYFKEERKVILFTERLVTATYLEEALERKLPFIRIANTVKETPKGAALKDFKEVLPLIKNFAPSANADKFKPNEKREEFDLLITTDAYSTGVNLQDASVVINYDLAWTPDVLIQRAGRILRFWEQPRQVDFLVFVGDFKEDLKGQTNTHQVEARLRKLSARSKQAQKFSEIPLIPESDKATYQSLGDLSSVTIEEIGLVDISQLEEFSGVSPYLRHIAILKEQETYAASIPNDISSARYYQGKHPLLYLLLYKEEEYYPILYNIQTNQIKPIKEDALLDLLQCMPTTPVANVNADEVEQFAQKARTLWEEREGIETPNAVERICACLLVSENNQGDFQNIL